MLRISAIGDVCAVGISPDTRRIVVACKGTIVLANAQTGKLLHKCNYSCHAAWCAIHAANFCPNGVYVVLGSADKTASIVDSRNGNKRHHITGIHSGAILDACFSPDGARVVLASADTTASIVDAHTGDLQLHIKGLHTAAINAARFSPDSSRLVLASADTTASVLDASTGDRLVHLQDIHDNAILAADFSPDGTWLVLGCADGTVSVVNADTQEERWYIHDEKKRPIRAVDFNLLALNEVIYSVGRVACVVDASTGHQLHKQGFESVHKDVVTHAFFGAIGCRAVLASADNTVSVVTIRVRGRSPHTQHQMFLLNQPLARACLFS